MISLANEVPYLRVWLFVNPKFKMVPLSAMLTSPGVILEWDEKSPGVHPGAVDQFQWWAHINAYPDQNNIQVQKYILLEPF